MKAQIMLALIAVSLFSVSFAYADDTQIDTALGSGAPGCETKSDGCYYPNVVTVDVGDTITFMNTDISAHTFTSGDPDIPSTMQVLFDSSLVMTGNTYQWKATESGKVPYFCMVHPWMKGMIIVSGGSETDQPPIEATIVHDVVPPSSLRQVNDAQIQIDKLQSENRELRQQIITLENEIDSLKDQIVALSGEFIENVRLLHKWFAQNLS